MTYTEISQLKYDLTDPYLRSWACRYGIVDLASTILVFRDIYLGNVRVRKQDLRKNDLAIFNRVQCWIDRTDWTL